MCLLTQSTKANYQITLPVWEQVSQKPFKTQSKSQKHQQVTMTIATETSLRTGWSREQFWCFATQLKSLFCRTLTRNSPENWSSCSQIKKSLRMIRWLYIYLASYLWLIYLCIIPFWYINKGILLVKHDSFQSGRKIIH